MIHRILDFPSTLPGLRLTLRIIFTFIICLWIALLLIFTGCVTCPVCPPQDSYVLHPYAGPTLIPKGLFENREAWKTEKEVKEWLDNIGDNMDNMDDKERI